MDFIGGLPPEREKYMSKKLKKQSVYSVADLESLKEFTVDEVKTYIDMIALHNMNRFHWHITEDQGCK